MLGAITPSFAQQAANSEVTLNERTPKLKVTVAPGTEITVRLVSKPRFGYHWEARTVRADCGHTQNIGNSTCFDPPTKPIQGDWPEIFVATIKAPDVKSTVEVSYSCFPPPSGNQLSPRAELIYDLKVVVEGHGAP